MHVSVLLEEVIKYLNVRENKNYIDCTLGAGGHSEEILKKNAPDGKLLAFELDEKAARLAEDKFNSYGKRIIIQKNNYGLIKEVSEALKFKPVSGILFDLGLSMDLIKNSGRGFSFMVDEPLDMRFDINQDLTAYQIVNFYSASEIEEILEKFGEEKFAKTITKQIINQRKKNKIKTTFELVEAIRESVPNGYTKRKTHFATKSFQAFRMAVNNELENIEKSLNQAIEILEPGGRLVVITFHSLEDRLVKQLFKKEYLNNKLILLTKKVVFASWEEKQKNPSSRSAKLRAIEKI